MKGDIIKPLWWNDSAILKSPQGERAGSQDRRECLNHRSGRQRWQHRRRSKRRGWLLASRLAYQALNLVDDELAAGNDGSWIIGVDATNSGPRPMESMPSLVDPTQRRPRDQWWLAMAPISRAVSDEMH